MLDTLEKTRKDLAAMQTRGKQASPADLIVLGGCAAVEKAARDAGVAVEVPFTPGRTDAAQEQTDVQSSAVLEPMADAFRNWAREGLESHTAELLVDRAQLLTLTAPEMTALIGGIGVLDTNVGHTRFGIFTQAPGTLSNDFIVHLLDMGTEWKPSSEVRETLGRYDRKTGAVKWRVTRVDLESGSNAELRSLCGVDDRGGRRRSSVTLLRPGTRWLTSIASISHRTKDGLQGVAVVR